MRDLEALLAMWSVYRQSRASFLSEIGASISNRDPMSEFSEVLVCALLGAERCVNRVQKGYDLIDAGGIKIEVKYLANPPGLWVNWHVIQASDTWDKYALVYFEDLVPRTVIVFPNGCLEGLYDALGKRHRNRGTSLEITAMAYTALTTSPGQFTPLGVEVFDLSRKPRSA